MQLRLEETPLTYPNEPQPGGPQQTPPTQPMPPVGPPPPPTQPMPFIGVPYQPGMPPSPGQIQPMLPAKAKSSKTPLWIALGTVGGLLLGCLIGAAIGSSGSSTTKNVSAAPTVTVTATTTEQAAAAATTPAAKPTATTSSANAADDTFKMPNEVDKVLQAAQDDIQRVSGNPLFITHSVDATGQGRHQILDRDWKVCSQNVKPGKQVSQDTDITFSVVKTYESCP